MACGTPVITSTVSSLPEVAGTDGAAQLIDPADSDALAEAMAQIMSRPDRRVEMSKQGRARAAGFQWEQTARQTVAVYQKVLAL
jgi:glycosyltransferase involved in cell wall biosynthesis